MTAYNQRFGDVSLDDEALTLIEEAEQFLAEQGEAPVAVKREGNGYQLGPSEPELRDEEVVCPITGLTYFKAYHQAHGRSPYVEYNPKTERMEQAW